MSTDYIPMSNRSQTTCRILEATIASLVTNGFAKTSIGTLATDLDVSKGVVHYHFPSKEMLLQETIAYIYETAFAEVRPGIDATADDWGKLEQFIRASVAFHRDRSGYVLALREILMNFRPIQHRSYAAKRLEQEFAEVSELLVAGQKHGNFRSFDPELMALTIRQALGGTTAKIGVEGYDFAHHTDELVALFYHGIVRQPLQNGQE